MARSPVNPRSGGGAALARIFVCHAFSSNPGSNHAAVIRIARRLALQGHLPLAPQLLFPHFIDETSERDLALKLCLQHVALADEVRVFGEVTEGMRLEIDEARCLRIPVLRGRIP